MIRTLAVCALLLSACSSTRTLSPGTPEAYRFNRLGERHGGTVLLQDGETLRGRVLRLEADTLRLYDEGYPTVRALPVEEVAEVHLRRRGKGALQGLGIGAGGGFVLGALYGAVTYKEKPCYGFIDICTRQGNAFVYGFGTALYGALLGPIVGAVRGSRERYLVQPEQP